MRLVIRKDPAPEIRIKVHRDAHDTELASQTLAAVRAGTHRYTVMQQLAIADPFGGLTDFQLDGKCGFTTEGAARKRRSELVDAGYVEDSGIRRASPSGADAIVWRLTPSGKDKWAEILWRGDK